MKNSGLSTGVKMAILVSALGYCVDVFDIVLFSVVRVSSLKSLGLSEDQILTTGVQLLNMQLVGMLVGGLLWGVVGDKIGRIQVLFGSILFYSVANLANAFVTSVEMYAVCRFVAGLGLAGEVGAGITLVAELMPKVSRGWGTTIVAAAGTFGAVIASVTVQYLDWRSAFFLGGTLGLLLLLLRVSVQESGIFNEVKQNKDVKRGDLRLLFSSRERFFKYIACILAGTPLFFAYYVLITFSPEVGRALGIEGGLSTAQASLFFCVGMTIGDLASGAFSQYLQSRRKALFLFIGAAFVCCAVLLSLYGVSATTFYVACIPTGFFIGYWAVYITVAAEQFGTNLRATVATTVPNFVRATPILMNILFISLRDELGVIPSLQVVGLLSFACSFYFLSRMRETFALDLNFVELQGEGADGIPTAKLEDETQQAQGWR